MTSPFQLPPFPRAEALGTLLHTLHSDLSLRDELERQRIKGLVAGLYKAKAEHLIPVPAQLLKQMREMGGLAPPQPKVEKISETVRGTRRRRAHSWGLNSSSLVLAVSGDARTGCLSF